MALPVCAITGIRDAGGGAVHSINSGHSALQDVKLDDPFFSTITMILKVIREMSLKRIEVRFISYLFRFLLFFEIDRFTLIEAKNELIRARVGWPDKGSSYHDEDDEI